MARILIVDDSIVSRTNLKNILADARHEVVGEAVDGEDGVAKFLSLRPDMVTMDITMPKLNGIECLKRILGHDPEARVMMISALGQGAKILEAIDSGARHYVTKPFEPDKVIEAVTEVLGD
ncbi:response regulator [Solidesulfovibrio sp.]|uniref:response regulator n=1 Tax=Solidesulfovibrio sp. TaxID=2910990 RepID=UPI002626D203|nr:response regulator [Solidesulfovibrio sp.]